MNLAGFKLRIDQRVPPNEVRFENGEIIVGRITNALVEAPVADTVSRRVLIVVGSAVALYGCTALAVEYLHVFAPIVSAAIGYAIGVVVHKYWS